MINVIIAAYMIITSWNTAPTVLLFSSIETCETARIALLKDLSQRSNLDKNISIVCVEK